MPETDAEAPSLEELVREARLALRTSGVAEFDLDARILAGAAFGLDPTRLRMEGARAATAEERTRLDSLIARRKCGEPVHRILGRRAFFAHEFALSPQTLEPRPDTEALVELCAEALAARPGEAGAPILFADLGTGTGAIAVSLLALFPRTLALAVDISPEALETARRNADAAGVLSRFLPLAGDFLGAVGATLDMIVSNPPYIPSNEIETLAPEVRDFDPRVALDGGFDGLSAYRAIAGQAASSLRPGGDLLLEIGVGQASEVRDLMSAAGFSYLQSRADLSGTERALWFRRDSVQE